MMLQTYVQTDTLQGAIKINAIIYDFCSKLSLLVAVRILRTHETNLFTWFKGDLTPKILVRLVAYF